MQRKLLQNSIDFVLLSSKIKLKTSCRHSVIRPSSSNIDDIINCAQNEEYNSEIICFLLNEFDIVRDPSDIFPYLNIYKISEIISVDYKINNYSIVFPRETKIIRPFFIRRQAYKPYIPSHHKNLINYLSIYNYRTHLPIEMFIKNDPTYIPSQ